MYPLKFRPILKTLVWGGEKIAPYKEINTDQKKIGESWELSAVFWDESESRVANGYLAGRTLRELLWVYKEELIGRANYEKTGEKFPLLVKFIDAKQDLSIQVHPDDELAAKRHGGSKGKTEMWYVINADKDAHLMSGFSQSITPEEYVERVNNNTITEVLNDYSLSPGDVFFLPAGRVHSIGAGSFIAEIQQTSDITYRIYDFGRLGLDGKPRELHTDLAKDAINYEVIKDARTHYEQRKNEEVLLVSCEYFTTKLLDLDRPFSKDLSDLDSFYIIICVEGRGEIVDNEGNRETIHQGETVLIPASTKSVRFLPESQLKVLTSYV